MISHFKISSIANKIESVTVVSTITGIFERYLLALPVGSTGKVYLDSSYQPSDHAGLVFVSESVLQTIEIYR
jgi:hypothetical protein